MAAACEEGEAASQWGYSLGACASHEPIWPKMTVNMVPSKTFCVKVDSIHLCSVPSSLSLLQEIDNYLCNATRITKK